MSKTLPTEYQSFSCLLGPLLVYSVFFPTGMSSDLYTSISLQGSCWMSPQITLSSSAVVDSYVLDHSGFASAYLASEETPNVEQSTYFSLPVRRFETEDMVIATCLYTRRGFCIIVRGVD